MRVCVCVGRQQRRGVVPHVKCHRWRASRGRQWLHSGSHRAGARGRSWPWATSWVCVFFFSVSRSFVAHGLDPPIFEDITVMFGVLCVCVCVCECVCV